MKRLSLLIVAAFSLLTACGPTPTPDVAATDTAIAQVKNTTLTAQAPTGTPTQEQTSTPTSTPTPTNTATSTPTSTHTATSTPTRTQLSQPVTVTPKPVTTVVVEPASTTAEIPQVISFTVIPTTTHTLGEKISLAWETIGTQAAICPIMGTGPVESKCLDVPLAGTTTITVDESALGWTGLGLRVKTAQTFVWSAVTVHLQCQGFRDWFFDNPPARCPEAPPVNSPAAAQHFERGLMIWVKQPDRFYIFYNGNEKTRVFDWIIGPYSFKPGASVNNSVGETPPPGYYEPVSGFGQVWRGEVEGVQGVRQRLGWATEPEFGYNTAYQCETPAVLRYWICYLRSPDGKVLRLHPDSTAQVRFNWEEW